MEVLETDVLIIGGSGGGMFAAINASQMGAKVLLVSKALLGRGGCSVTFGYTSGSYYGPAKGQAVDSTEDKSFPDKIKYYTHYLADQELAKAAWAYGSTFCHRMEQMGLYFRRTEDGTLVTCGGLGYGPISAKMGSTGKGIMDVLRSHLFDGDVSVLEESMATCLILDDGRVVGACVFDYAHGKLYEVRARAVIIATGHVNYLWARSTATREMSANGLAMAFRAGAELCGIEMLWYHIADIARPRAWMRSHMYPNPIPLTTAVVEYYNSAGELFFHGNMYRGAQPSYYLQCKHLAQQVAKGLARKDGGYYAYFGKIDPHILQTYTMLDDFLRKLGYDPATDKVECAMTAHQMRGGVLMDHSMMTRLPGLFVAGSVAADFVTGIVTVCWEAETAARAAVEHANRVAPGSNAEAAWREEQRIVRLLVADPATPVLPAVVKDRLRELMWQEMDYFKSEEKIRRAIAGISELRDKVLPNMRIPSKSLAGNWDLVDALDVPDMLDVAQLIATASLLRKESRGAFYRMDYPFSDNMNWLKNIALSGSVEEPQVRFVPVNTKYIRPPDDRADFLTSEY